MFQGRSELEAIHRREVRIKGSLLELYGSTERETRLQQGDIPVRRLPRMVALASLYAFWVSRDETGRSDGYVAGGGPGFTGMTDTVGRAALDAEARLGTSIVLDDSLPRSSSR